MLERSPAESTGYWLSLVVAIGIATMGLVLDSAAVVIAAMLIAPLMTPIVALGMGLAVGSPFLVLRSTLRVALSVAATLGLSALITRFLPYYDLNAQIVARTSPTVLDLVTAVFFALAGVYATLRPSSDVASTAAGTSIGISLLPRGRARRYFRSKGPAWAAHASALGALARRPMLPQARAEALQPATSA